MGYITINTIADQQVGETLVVTLNDATTSMGTASVGRPNRVETTTTAQDTVTVSVAATDGELTEGAAEEFTVTLTGGEHSDAVRVNYTVGGDVTSDDYNEDPSGTLTFATGDRSEMITLNCDGRYAGGTGGDRHGDDFAPESDGRRGNGHAHRHGQRLR